MSERMTDRKRRSIVEAAMHEFRTGGFDNTSMDQIAETAGVSKRTVYNHFSSKDELFDSIVERLIERVGVIPPFEYRADADLSGQLVKIATDLTSVVSDGDFQSLARVMMSRMLTEPEMGRLLTEQTNHLNHQLAEWLAAADHDKRLRVSSPEIAAEQLVGLLLSYAFWPRLFGIKKKTHRWPVKRYIEDLVRMFLRAYAVDDSKA
ncbi:TetR/AcrR family transcriptional regulator [Novipirellula artificiosorum]|uniref:HTH-type transcriptional regulator RutR n=1 Tax=Novipirellula artificiosorum TaxID=2528016 RepID=A0A5C6DWQ3_9BACT|nr:TetR/AcrR family transcriptional regulator [Novipirellula artificiosorum]TWU40634.1 HTH-type transcriptional regulator RutR [Novipirellula artificiosorum]